MAHSLIVIVLLCLMAIANASVLKPGRKSGISDELLKTSHGQEFLKYLKYNYKVIFPGTKWCGDGDIAENDDDLGYFVETDKCCRAHDHCEDIIYPGESKHGLVNEGKFTKLNCACDDTFLKCLATSKCKIPSGIVGTTYFNVVADKCFDYRHPATCIKYKGKRCIKYEYDTSKSEIWQWFDLPKFF